MTPLYPGGTPSQVSSYTNWRDATGNVPPITRLTNLPGQYS